MRDTQTSHPVPPPPPATGAPDVPATSSAPSGSCALLPKPVFTLPASVATQSGPHGIRFDFNDGCRVTAPAGGWRVRLRDADTDNRGNSNARGLLRPSR